MSKIHSGRKFFCRFYGEANRGSSNRGFSLVEILVVVLIMGILVGVIGSLMGGFITNFEMTDDQSIARRRAADVFNILQTPLLYAGMGIPADNFDYYFEPIEVGGIGGVGGSPIQNWPGGPVSIIDTTGATVLRGPIMRIVYTVPAGVKYKGTEHVLEFSEGAPNTSGGASPLAPGSGFVTAPRQIDLSGSVGSLVARGEILSNVYDTRSYVTFPGIRMHPAVIYGTNIAGIEVVGKIPRQIRNISDDVVERNVIRPFHDMYLVRAGVAFVDDNSTFIFADIRDSDITSYSSVGNREGYRVEGIKAIYFEPTDTPLGNHITGVRVYAIAEGDNAITGRHKGSSSLQSLKNNPRWSSVTFDDDVFYEEFQMQWRTRSIEAPGA